MSTSGTTTYTTTRDDIITEALSLLEVLEEGTTANASQVSDSVDSLQRLIKSFSTKGMHIWKRTTITINPLVLDKQTYTIGPSGADITADKPLQVHVVNTKDSNSVEIPMSRMSLTEYDDLSDKTTSSGTPVQYYFNPELTTSSISIWPVANSDAVTNRTIDIVAYTYIEDVTSGNDELDLPAEWYDTVVWNLAYRLSPRFGYPLTKRRELRKDAKELLDDALEFGAEEGSIFFQVDNK